MFIDVNHEHMHAITLQQIAAVRQRWVESDRDAYYINVRYAAESNFHACAADECVNSFIMWSDERAEYAARARKEMGITDNDQYYA